MPHETVDRDPVIRAGNIGSRPGRFTGPSMRREIGPDDTPASRVQLASVQPRTGLRRSPTVSE